MVGTVVTHYIALIHKEPDSCYGVSFSDVPGVTTAADTLDDAIRKACEALAFAAEDWTELSGEPFPQPRTIDELRADPQFLDDAAALVAAIPFKAPLGAAAE
ncbi:MAG TPA: type II toxin-antitoxin system HicB family antitoxin [Afifellaceae bacterium]|nr:type II toxin-antitoxin system HicB family antitoxin [Afifellaceae bacterium]